MVVVREESPGLGADFIFANKRLKLAKEKVEPRLRLENGSLAIRCGVTM